jgi:hypothetical protein
MSKETEQTRFGNDIPDHYCAVGPTGSQSSRSGGGGRTTTTGGAFIKHHATHRTGSMSIQNERFTRYEFLRAGPSLVFVQ